MQIPKPLYPRTILKEVIKYLNEETIIVVHGSRQVGKTYFLYNLIDYLEKRGQKIFYFDLEDPLLLITFNQGYTALINLLKAQGYEENERAYVFIDEIQYLDNPSPFLKMIADHYKDIHLVVSGSSTFAIRSKFKDQLVGRTVNFELFPLSFSEFLEFKGLKYDLTKIKTPYDIEQLKSLYTEFLTFGGYPKIVLTNSFEKKKTFLSQIIDTYIRKDIKDLGEIEDVKKFNSLLFVLASYSGQLLNVARLSKETSLSIPTLNKYLFLLEQTFIIKLLPPFSKNPHVEIVKSPKVYFYDSGLTSLLWLRDFPKIVIGSLFETSVFAEYVKKYGKESLYYWRTKNKLEIDLILNMLPVEVKVNFESFDKNAISSFQDKYRVSDFRVVGILGTKKGSNFIYPWEI